MHRTLVKTFGKIVSKVSKHGRLILTVGSIVGLGETVYLTAKASPEAKEALDKAREEKGEELTLVEKVKTTGRIYAPVALSAGVTAGLIIYNHRLGTKKLNKAIAAAVAARKAYAGLASEYDDYKKCAEEVVGSEVVSQINDKLAEKKVSRIPDDIKKNVVRDAPGSREKGSMLCWIPRVSDMNNYDYGDFFWATPEELDAAEGKFNKHLQEYGWVGVDFYRGYFDLPWEDDEWGYNLRCECFSGWKENDWIHINRSKASINGIDCTLISFEHQGLCCNFKDACCGDMEECDYSYELPFR